ncbi:MAG TPA: hypothetical protein VIT91_02540, partial [Chthoniobacterales bacterium]
MAVPIDKRDLRESAPTVSAGSGLKQSLRVLWFSAAFLAFLTCTYLAFFHCRFRSEPADAKLFSFDWWLHPLEFNAASRIHRVDPEVDFTCISATADGWEIWVGGSKGLILHSSDAGKTWEPLETVKVAPESTPPPAGVQQQQQQQQQQRDITKSPDYYNQAIPFKGPVETEATPEPTPQTDGRLLSNDIVDLDLVSPSVAYAVTAAGEIIGTRDGAKTWRLLRPPRAQRV